MDLHLDVRWGVALGASLLAGAPGCQLRDGLVIDFDLREFAYADPDDVSAHRSGVERRSALRLIAEERLYVMPRRLLVDVTSETIEGDDAGQRVRTTIDHDWERGLVWSAIDDDGPALRRLLAELDYEAENRYRRNLIDFVTYYVESAAVRRMPDVQWFLGDGRVEDTGTTSFAGQTAVVLRIAAFPGIYWDAWVLPLEETPFESADEVSAYLVGAMGVPPSRAPQIVESLGGAPMKITATVFAGPDSQVLIEGFLRDAIWKPDLPRFDPLPDPSEDEELRARLADVEFLLDSVRHLDQLSSGMTPGAVFLKLSEHMTPELLDAALEIFFALDDTHAQVELARSLLRSPRVAAWDRLRGILLGERGALALSVVEALIAEADARALSALLHVLGRAGEFADFPRDAVVEWGLGHLRVLSGMPLAELVEYSTPGAIPDTLERSSAARSAELDRWFRWWGKKQASVPQF